MVVIIENSLQLSSDLYFRIKHRGNLKNKLICRCAINPAFVCDKYLLFLFSLTFCSVVYFNKKSVDPDSIARNSKYSPDFKVEIHFKDICPNCKPTDPKCKLCPSCLEKMASDLVFWDIITKILEVSSLSVLLSNAL